MIILGGRNNGAPFPAGCVEVSLGITGEISAEENYPITGDNTMLMWVAFPASEIESFFRIRSSSGIEAFIYQRPTANRLLWSYQTPALGSQVAPYSSDNFDGSIRLIVIRHKASTGLVELFVDGVLLDSFTAVTSAISGGELEIIPSVGGIPTKCSGLFIYSDFLTDTELSDVLTYGALKLPADNMFLGWPMCEQTGSVLYDVSGNGRDGAWSSTPGFSTQTDIFYPKQKGYSKYTKTGEDDLFVPFGIDGNALTITPPSGYTKAFDAPA